MIIAKATITMMLLSALVAVLMLCIGAIDINGTKTKKYRWMADLLAILLVGSVGLLASSLLLILCKGVGI